MAFHRVVASMESRVLCEGSQEQKLPKLGKNRAVYREGEGRGKTGNQWDAGSGAEHEGRD